MRSNGSDCELDLRAYGYLATSCLGFNRKHKINERINGVNDSEILALSRAVERPLITIICGMSIFLGYRLFVHGIIDTQKSDISFGGWKARLERVGPGIFFALFGMIGLVVAITHSFSINNTGTSSVLSSLGGDADALRRSEVRALNQVIDPPKNGQEINLEGLKASIIYNKIYFEAIRREILLTKLTPDDIELWNQHRQEFQNGQITNKALKEKMFDIEPYMEGIN